MTDPSPKATSLSVKQKQMASVGFLLLVLLVVLVLILLADNPPPRPLLPRDEVHQNPDWKSCLQCHGEGKSQALKPSHPIKKDLCLRCHIQDKAPAEPGR